MTGRQRYFGEKLGRNERGGTLVLVTLFIFVLFGFAALSLDVANVYREKHRLHAGTDAAALAGVGKVGDPAIDSDIQKANAIAEAQVIANTNGVMDAEIRAGPTSTCAGCLAEIQVGLWGSPMPNVAPHFMPNVTPYNAVRVPAQRIVPLNFGKIGGPLGFPVMKPTVESIATIGVPTSPYWVPQSAVPAGTTNLTLQSWPGGNGNWGALNLCGKTTGAGNNPTSTETAISNGTCYATVGEVTTSGTGVAGVPDGFCDRWKAGNTIMVLPVVDIVPSGANDPVTVINFVIIRLLQPPNPCQGGGSGWTEDVEVLGMGFNDLKKFGLGPIRSLVE